MDLFERGMCLFGKNKIHVGKIYKKFSGYNDNQYS